MVVQHNLQAMNANRMLGITTKQTSKSTEKLSSGYRINRAADDAAGLAISEKMRKQMRGLTQAAANAEDGISSVQTAEGALAEVQDMLQRINELCVQAANGTNAMSDRQYIQDEIDQLITEIDRISATTKFNELYLLKGDEDAGLTNKYMADYKTTTTMNYNYTGEPNIYIVEGSAAQMQAMPKSEAVSPSLVKKGDSVTQYLDDTQKLDGKYIAFKNNTIDPNLGGAHLQRATGGIAAVDDLYFYDTDTRTITHVAPGEVVSEFIDNNNNVLSRYRFLGTGPDADTDINDNIKGKEEKYVLYDSDGNPVSAIALNNYYDDDGNYLGGLFLSDQPAEDNRIVSTTQMANAKVEVTTYVKVLTTAVTNPLEFDLHVGSDSDLTNKIRTEIMSISSAGIGIEKLYSNRIGIVDRDGANATSAIDVVTEALRIVSTQRSALGAVQNRLEHTVSNLNNVVENTTAAESQIRDTDMAEQMVKYSNDNILQQAGQAMLAQANQSNQGVLTLLQG